MNKEIFTNSILQTHIVRMIWKIVDEYEMNDERGGKERLFKKIGSKNGRSDSEIVGIFKLRSGVKICAFGDFNENGRQW